MEQMNSSKPYLLRAIHEWIVDNGLTPYLLVDATVSGVSVPPQHIADNKIILNVSPRATQGLSITNEWVQFSARFGGSSMNVSFPPGAVLAIYARENGQGMIFEKDEGGPTPPEPDKPGRPQLKVVK